MTDQHETTGAEWRLAYCAAFRRVARARGWTDEHIESGWLDNGMPDEALATNGRRDPAEVAAEDVIECEIEAANA